MIQSKEPERREAQEYRQLVKGYYDGPAGWFTLVSGFFTGHESLAAGLFRPDAFDLRGCKRILDTGCGNGRYLRFLLRRADPDAELVGFDLSVGMLQRARRRLECDRPHLLVADLIRLPFRDEQFDAIISGWVFEHLQQPEAVLREMARVLRPGGKLLLMTTEHTVLGAICSRVYHCRTTRREDLKTVCGPCGLTWHREYWWTPVHKLLRLGGIVVELRRTKYV
jgi:ubiquinone/menaquinone biosynthesis C-methylase UbiE